MVANISGAKIAHKGFMRVLYLVLALIALGVFAAVVLSVAVVVFIVALAGWIGILARWSRRTEPGDTEHAVKVSSLAEPKNAAGSS